MTDAVPHQLFAPIVELKQLRYFVAVATHGSVAAAARTVHIAQPALSRHIAALEDELSVKLFARLPRGASLTRAGEALLVHANEALARSEALREEIRLAANGKAGTLRVGIIPGFSWLPTLGRAIASLTAGSPRTEVVITSALSIRQIDAIKRQDLDAGFVAWRSPFDAAITGMKVHEETMLAALPESMAMQLPQTPSAKDLSALDFILFPRDDSPMHHDALLRMLDRIGISPRRRVVASDFPAIIGLVSAGVGWAMLPASYRANCPDNVVLKHVPDLDFSVSIELVWRTGSTDPLLASFVNNW